MDPVIGLYILGLALIEVGMGRARTTSHSLMKAFTALAGGWLTGLGLSSHQALMSGVCALLTTIGPGERLTLPATFAIACASGLLHRLLFVLDTAFGQAISHHLPPSLFHFQGVQSVIARYWVSDYGGLFSVHTLGAGAAFGTLVAVGPRIGRYSRTGAAQALPPHSFPTASAGVFLLWLGLYGMAPGLWSSVTTAGIVSFLAALVVSRIWFGKEDPSFGLTGLWAGLIAGLACPSAQTIPLLVIGLVTGPLAIGVSVLLDRAFIDDPIGVVPAEGMAPLIGLICLWFDGGRNVGAGFLPWLLAFGSGWAAARIFCRMLSIVGWLRPRPDDELAGLDQRLYGVTAYPDFEIRGA